MSYVEALSNFSFLLLPPVRHLRPVMVHYMRNNHTEMVWIGQKYLIYKYFDKLSWISCYNLRSMSLECCGLFLIYRWHRKWTLATWHWRGPFNTSGSISRKESWNDNAKKSHILSFELKPRNELCCSNTFGRESVCLYQGLISNLK